MRHRIRLAIGSLIATVLAGLLSGCHIPKQVSLDGRLAIFVEPQDQTVPVGSPANFSVVAHHIGPAATNAISYQWRKDGVTIPGATNATFTINNALIADVGQYSVLVTGSSLLSESANLAVYTSTANGGTLTVALSSFKAGNNGQACFPTSSNWDRYYVLPGYLLGPNVSPLPNPNPFPNPNNLNSVTIDTIDALNGTTLDTGIVINYDFNPSDKICNDDASPPNTANPKLSRATYAPTGNGRKYRATVFYKSASGPPANVTVHWNYP